MLVKSHGGKYGGDKSWLLIKERDEYARTGADAHVVDTEPQSVASGRDLDAIAADPERVWHSNKTVAENVRTGRVARKQVDASAGKIDGARKAALPADDGGTARNARRRCAGRRRLAARDQVRRLSDVVPHRPRQMPDVFAHRQGMDSIVSRNRRRRCATARRIRVDRRRGRRQRRQRALELPGAAERAVRRIAGCAALLRVRPSVSRRLRSSRRAARGAQGSAANGCRRWPR